MADDALSLDEVAEYLRLPRESVYKYVRSGRMPARKDGRRWVFSRAEIDVWVEGQGNHGERIPRVLVVDDEAVVRHVFRAWLDRAGYEVVEAGDGRTAIELAGQDSFDLALLDLKMPGMDGAQTLQVLRGVDPSLRVVIATAYYESELMERALLHGPVTVLKKPVGRETFLAVVSAQCPVLPRPGALPLA